MSKLSDKILDYTKKTEVFYPPYLYKKWGVEPEEFTEAICNVWYQFPNPRVIDNLLNINVSVEPEYYEVCNQKFNRGQYTHRDYLWEYCIKNQTKDQHISVYSHDSKWIQNYQEKKTVSCQGTKIGADYVYLELDRPTLKETLNDACVFYESFPYKDYITVWYSGNKSTHIQIDGRLFGRPMGQQENIAGRYKLIYNLAHDIAGDLRHDNNITDPYILTDNELYKEYTKTFGEVPEQNKQKHQQYRQELENIDPNIYSTNSLIRQPFSIHEKGEKPKCLIPIQDLKEGKTGSHKKRKLDFYHNNDYIDKQPWLLHKTFENYESTKKSTRKINVDESEVIKVYARHVKDFDPQDANAQGWAGPYFNPLYEDTNPSVFINLESGHLYDHGSYEHSMTFNQFKENINEQNL